jgi:hypothetical protein
MGELDNERRRDGVVILERPRHEKQEELALTLLVS